MLIGDLVMRVLINDKAFDADLQKTAAKSGDKAGKTLGSKMSGGLKGAFSKKDMLGLIGLGAGVGIATLAMGKLVNVMGDAVAAAIEEEKSISKLDAALRANVKGYDGNTKAIEDTLASRMRLGFADDEQRDSLALLIAATGDYNKALTIQRTAMDLARLKGISLAEASSALIKIENGQFRALKALGIQLPKNATATEALAAVQKVAAGQAEAYANTTEGKLLASQIRVGDAMEKLGAVLLPIVTDAALGAADAVETLAGVFGELGQAMDDASDPVRDNDDVWGNFLNILDDINTRGEDSKTALGRLDEELTNFVDDLADSFTFWDGFTKATDDQTAASRNLIAAAKDADTSIGIVSATAAAATPPVKTLGDTAETAGEKTETAFEKAKAASKAFRDEIISAAEGVITRAYEIISDQAALSAANVETAELAKVIATGKATKEQKARYKELGETQAKTVLSLAKNGVIAGRNVNTAMNQIRTRLKTATGQERSALLATLQMLQRLAAQAAVTSRAVGRVNTAGARYGGHEVRASGGPVSAGVPYVVGERRAELFVPKVDGTILPSVPKDWQGGTTSAGNTYNINLLDRMKVETVRDLGDGVRMLDDQGYLR